MKLLEAIAETQHQRWLDQQRKEQERIAEEEARTQREQDAGAAFLKWFRDRIGIEVEEGELCVKEKDISGIRYDVWWRFQNGGHVHLMGHVIPFDEGYSVVREDPDGPFWHACYKGYYCDYREFIDAAIYALDLPRVKPRDNAPLASEDGADA